MGFAFWGEGDFNLLNPILFVDPIYKIALIWIARKTLSFGINFITAQVLIIEVSLLILVLSPIFIQATNYRITYYLLLLNSYVLPSLALIPFIGIRIMGYKSLSQALLKSIVPLLLVSALLVPAITLASHSEQLKTKRQLDLLPQPDYLLGGMGKIAERVGTNRIQWVYYCHQDGNLTSGNFIIAQTKLGETDWLGEPANVQFKVDKFNKDLKIKEEQRKTEDEEYTKIYKAIKKHEPLPTLEEISITGSKTYLISKFLPSNYSYSYESSYVLFWEIGNKYIELSLNSSCQYNKEDLIKIAESMIN